MKYTIIVDKQPKTNPSAERKTYEIDIEELRYKDNVKDTLVITKDEDYVMRRLELSEYHVLSVLDTPKKEILKDINIELFEGDNYIYIADETGSRFYAEYLISNEFNDMYVLKSELNSKIEQLADSVEIGVNKKLEEYSTTEEMNAAINVKSEEITIGTNKNITTAKQEAISTANSATDTKLQDYSTTEEIKAMIKVSEGSISLEVGKVKQEAIDSANSATDTKLQNYSTTAATNQAKQEAINSANSATDTKLSNYSTTEDTEQAKQEAITSANSNTNTKLANYSTKDETTQAKQDAISSANSATDTKLQDYSTTAATNQAKNDAINSANFSTDTKLKGYSTIDATNQAKQDAIDSANTSTDNKLKNYSTTTEITGKLQLKLDKNDNDQVVSMLNASANEINIYGNRLSIESDNFTLDKEGNMDCKDGNINTNRDITVGNNLYVGRDQTIGNKYNKYIYFNDNAYIMRQIFGSGKNYLKLHSDLNTRIECGDTGHINVMENSISMSHTPSISSDKRLKKNIKDVDVSWIDDIKIKEFEYKNNPDKKHIGIIAQDYLDEEYSKYFINQDEKGMYSVAYMEITNALIKYCQELKQEIKDLKEGGL